MAKRAITVILGPDELAALHAGFAGSDGKPVTEDAIDAIAAVAVKSLVAQLTGRKRYRSLTELYIDWLTELYSGVLIDEEPSERRLFSKLGFPHGQAMYLARVLRDKQQGVWRKKALTSLRDALRAQVVEVQKWVKEGRSEDRMMFHLSKGSRLELDNALGALAERGAKGIGPSKPEGNMGSVAAVSITASNVPDILQEIEDILKTFPRGDL